MLLLISPAKSLDFESPHPKCRATQARFLDDSAALVDVLREYSPHKLASLMSISDALAALNFDRFANWQRPIRAATGRPAVFAFDGDVYDGLQARLMAEEEVHYAQTQLRILSGLYGVLRPLDLILPYRLEMGTRLKNPQGKDLYAWWGTKVTDMLRTDLRHSAGERVVVNCASEEYFKVVKPEALNAPVVTPVFQEWKNGQWKIVSFFAKRARGLMARFAIEQRIEAAEDLKAFELDGYRFDATASRGDEWYFRRKQVV